MNNLEVNSKSQFRRVTAQLVSKLDAAEALAASRKELLRRAKYFLEFVPIGLNDDDMCRRNKDIAKRFHQLMDELAKELDNE
jgi:tryptophanyl-tRNA synthetase